MARKIVEENIQIEEFRKKVVENFILESKFKEAKKLINDYIQKKESKDVFWGRYTSHWDVLLL